MLSGVFRAACHAPIIRPVGHLRLSAGENGLRFTRKIMSASRQTTALHINGNGGSIEHINLTTFP